MTTPKPIEFDGIADSLSKIVTPSTKHMTQEERQHGIETMLEDLYRLGSEDGCIAAAWALEFAQVVSQGIVFDHTAESYLGSRKGNNVN